MSLTRKINNVTEFKASEISLLKTILHLDDKERGLSTIRNYITLKRAMPKASYIQGLSTIRNYITLKPIKNATRNIVSLSTIRNYITLKQKASIVAETVSLSTIRNYITLKLLCFTRSFF